MRRLTLFLLLLASALTVRAVKVGVVMPFKAGGPQGKAAVEFYRGFLLAVDSVKRGGLSVEVYAVDSGTSEASLNEALARGELKGAAVVFGPGVAGQAEALAAYCKQWGLKLVMPFPVQYQHLADNALVYQVSAPEQSLCPAAAQLAMENLADANFVMLKCSDGTPSDHAFQAAVSDRVTAYSLPHGTLNINADEVAAQMAFNASHTNVIVPDSHTDQTLSSLLKLLKQYRQKYPKYRFALLGFPSWLTLAAKYSDDLCSLDTYVFSQSHYGPVSSSSLSFGKKYSESFNTALPREYPSAAMLGFDVGYYFLCGVNSSPFQQDLSFRRVG
ncbi:MAG: hypothetical protein LUC86_08530, partial [Prevotellaceae bacterium]|nr:hypothetical protein [Prevotellaceae bacterium]